MNSSYAALGSGRGSCLPDARVFQMSAEQVEILSAANQQAFDLPGVGFNGCTLRGEDSRP